MFELIKESLNKRMKGYADSRHPTDDEVTIAWLITEVERLKVICGFKPKANDEIEMADPPITNYVVTGTRVYGPVADDSDLDLVMRLDETYQLKQFLTDRNISIFQTEGQESYNNTGTAGFYFSLGGLLINIIIPENQAGLKIWEERTEAMKKLPHIADREERLAMFRSL